MAKPGRPKDLLGLLIHLLRLLLSSKAGPIWLRVLAAVLIGLLLAIQVVCGGIVSS
jgi:hypothetical protein